jgi:uncharacterized SAM-binding protein YcdF (DUF218 family)
VRTLGLALALVSLVGCRDLRDVFLPYRADAADVRAVLAQPLPPPPLDVALVLGCPAERDGTPSLCQRCRVKTAVREYRRGHVRKLLFSGGAAHSPAVEADVMAALAESRGVPPADVLREPRALTTWQNVRFSLALMRAHGLRSTLVVSTADHLPRARRILRFYGADDAQTGYRACDREPREESDQPPTKTNG